VKPADEEQLSALNDWITAASERGAIAILTHRNGDMDTIGSALALASSCDQAMACGVHLGRLARKMVEELDAPFLKMDFDAPRWPRRLGGIIVVDSASAEQTGVELPDDIPLCIIDHHSTNDWNPGLGGLSINWAVSATTQIIHSYLQRYQPSALSEKVRTLLLAGLVTDTGRFRHADEFSFDTAASLLKDSALDYRSFIESLEESGLTRSDKGAVAKALSRSQGIDAGGWWLLKSSASTQESVVCRALMSAGADVAIVVRRRDGVTRLTSRASRQAIVEGVQLGSILDDLADAHGGEGGGHDGAAGWSSDLDVIAVESAFIHALTGIPRS
jgi:nanoRNase/pAp phosphatase (c-di-AMP/oligoRNAs hydrolase)